MRPNATLDPFCPEHCRELIAASGLSQREIARRLGVSTRSLQHWLCGTRRPLWAHWHVLQQIVDNENT